MKRIIFLILIYPSVTIALSPKFDGEMEEKRERWLKPLERYIVPTCERWLLQDIHKLGGQSYLSITGKIEITSSPRHSGESHKLEGEFKYTTSNWKPKFVVILHPGASLVFSGENGVGVVEYSWYEKDHPCQK